MKEFFRALYRGWMKFAHVLGVIQTTIILFVIYVVVFGLAGLALFVGRADLLDKRRRPGQSHWKPVTADWSPERSLRQF